MLKAAFHSVNFIQVSYQHVASIIVYLQNKTLYVFIICVFSEHGAILKFKLNSHRLSHISSEFHESEDT